MRTYTTIVGMEIHVELATASKMFCGCKNDPFYAEKPNIYTCPVCLGMPGGLPVPNKKAIEWTIRLGLALGCEIQNVSKFDRKHYFYPDLAKGYQISQLDLPFCKNGVLQTAEGPVRINRVHLEEDTGKLQHIAVDGKKVTLVDYNRSGIPLVEIVTEPDIHSSGQAKEFLKKLQQIIRYLEISAADMEKGSMRLEPNISVAHTPVGKTPTLPKYKVEVKNINSFNFVKRAIDFEAKRHIELLERGETPKQETRGYVESTSSTVSQRSKENAIDYRYFPEPDIPPIRLTNAMIEEIKRAIPELPEQKEERFVKEYHLPARDAKALTETIELAEYFESCVSLAESAVAKTQIAAKHIANTIINTKILQTEVSPAALLAGLEAFEQGKQIDPEIMIQTIEKIVTLNAKAVEDYKKGKDSAIMFLVGQVKRELQGKGDAAYIKEALKKRIS